ncbi:TonB-dependent receptor domain-containing protein [Lewinella cohaerens]|uniref:TonB-dependent receptor domain-containing protein n=1 Tax=Lewinella cohaerens TaxID=70995 RepID=UPI00035FF9DD|nr:TonB-dependent receptor [Lewinella cohaerens]
MKNMITLLLLAMGFLAQSQSASIKGQLQDPDGEAVVFANVALYNSTDSTLVKVETTDEAGVFRIQGLSPGSFNLSATYVGAADLWQNEIALSDGQQLDLEVLQFTSTSVELEQATVTATRALVEVKPDRTVFNVQGTINSTGADAISLLRKAPGVTVDNNDNISVLGRAGVLLYVDGKRLPLTGQDLTSYLQNLQADQIDHIDIISNPGAKYEAEGNAGIIDIRLKKDKNLGSNGSISGTYSQGQYARMNGSASGNYRNKWMNLFATAGANDGEVFNNMNFFSTQNGIQLDETNRMRNSWQGLNARLGTDFFINDQHTIGFLVSVNDFSGEHRGYNRIAIANLETPNSIDSILVSDNISMDTRQQQTYNINYRYDNRKGRTINLDVDYGNYDNDSDRSQPNRYYDAQEQELLTEVINAFNTPTQIDIYTAKLDYEQDVLGGKLGLGTKLSQVSSDNTFLVFDIQNGVSVRDNQSSNIFDYRENVYAGYVSFTRPINEKWNFSAGLRAEQTDAEGNLQPFDEDLQEPPVILNYLSWFPNAGLTWQVAPTHSLSLNYGRRINRPDYNVLNPFNNQLSQLSYEKGNPFLQPEIVNNVELSYTLKYRYNFKVGYSKTIDQITRLIAPDEQDDRANFISWENLADQTIYSMNISAPFQVMEGWNSYVNFSASHLNNQADYGDGAIVDVQVFTYSIYQQQTIDLPGGFKGEVSGYYSGPGVWGGVFKYESSWSLDLGLQKKFLNDQLNVRLSASDLFYETGWDGVSEFNGLISSGGGNWDSRRVSLSMSYNFGNQNVKSRRRNTGLEDEAKRLGN